MLIYDNFFYFDPMRLQLGWSKRAKSIQISIRLVPVGAYPIAVLMMLFSNILSLGNLVDSRRTLFSSKERDFKPVWLIAVAANWVGVFIVHSTIELIWQSDISIPYFSITESGIIICTVCISADFPHPDVDKDKSMAALRVIAFFIMLPWWIILILQALTPS